MPRSARNAANHSGRPVLVLRRETPIEYVRRLHDVVIAPLTGPEVITGSTRMKAGTATKLVLNTITTGAMVLSGYVYGNLMVDLQVTCDKLQDRGERILMETLSLHRKQARDLLRNSEGRVKVAIVMGKLDVSPDEAVALLEAHDGLVARVVGDPP